MENQWILEPLNIYEDHKKILFISFWKEVLNK